ncbi:MAG TPA: hypothetical protein GXX36_12740 [Clostridiaceae bacterium]|nr:hypothetical protein [Clostridiaceae bacterium]
MSLDLKFEQLIKGELKYKSVNLALNLLISRLQRKYAANKTPAELTICLQEMKAFVEKYSSIMTKDIEEIKKL